MAATVRAAEAVTADVATESTLVGQFQKKVLRRRFGFRSGIRAADQPYTMDWEGGTIGAIVPALMGHGEAGRASPWPFSCADT